MLNYQKQTLKGTEFTIGLDLDGTSSGFHRSFRDVLIAHQGWAPTAIPVRTPNVYSYVEAGIFPCENTFKKALFAATGHGVYRKAVPYRGFRKAIRSLVDDFGAGIRVITSRPDDALEDTVYWLENVAKVPFHDVHICHDKTKVKADVYIDDMPAHIAALRGKGRTAVVYHQPYNSRVEGDRLRSWTNAAPMLNSLARVNA